MTRPCTPPIGSFRAPGWARAAVPALLLATAAAAAAGRPAEDARDAIERYFRADALGSAPELRGAFAPDATIVDESRGRRVRLTPGALSSRVAGPAPDESRRVRRVESLTAKEQEASAVLVIDTPGEQRREEVTLRPIEGVWRIVRDRRRTTRKPSGRAQMRELEAKRMKPLAPFRILGNLYYVGASDISAFLLTTPAGHVLLDSGPVEMLPMLERNVAALGFRLADVKLLLNSHAHYDHCGGFAEVRRRSGARILASEADGDEMARGGRGDFAYGDDYPFEPVSPDRRIQDGERVQLGGVTLTAMLTPGHTRGCTTWLTRIEEDGAGHDVVFLCGLTVSPFKLTNNPVYPGLVEDTRRSIARLRTVPSDALLAAHGFWFDLGGKAARLARARLDHAPNPFLDRGELGRHLDEMQHDLDQALEAQERPRPP